MSDELEIVKRLLAATYTEYVVPRGDVKWLVTEIERLQDQNERLLTQNEAWRADFALVVQSRDDARAEIERLARWKAEATLVLDQWDEVYDALGQPGELGELKSEAALAEVIRLRTENERLRDLVKGVGWLVAESDAALGGERE